MSKAQEARVVSLPARTDDPHGWLWRVIFAEADRRLEAQEGSGDRVAVAAGLWEGIVAGRIWVRRDRSGLSFDEPDAWLSHLVDAEAERHLLLSDGLDHTLPSDDPFVVSKTLRPRTERQANISLMIWCYLSNGWVRVAERPDQILFWDPTTGAFVTFSHELNLTYVKVI
jgi:hypothetical protein